MGWVALKTPPRFPEECQKGRVTVGGMQIGAPPYPRSGVRGLRLLRKTSQA